jgi:tetratricopeptide (TPR) repeat protein
VESERNERFEDDWADDSAATDWAEAVYEVDYAALARRDDIPVEASVVLRLFDGRRGLLQVLDDCDFEGPALFDVIARLRAEGVLRPPESRRAHPVNQFGERLDEDDPLDELGPSHGGRRRLAFAGGGAVALLVVALAAWLAPRARASSGAMRHAAPDSKVVRSADSKIVATPDSKVVATPDSKVVATPDSKVVATPDSKVVATPDSRVVATPDSKVADSAAGEYRELVGEGERLAARDRRVPAMRAFRHALALRPDGAEAMCGLAAALLDGGDVRAAATWADRALAADPRSARAYLIKGTIAQQENRTPEARRQYRRYLELAPHGEYAEEVRSILGSAQ